MSDTLARTEADLIDAINGEHHAAETAARSAIEHARQCGALLAEAKRDYGRAPF